MSDHSVTQIIEALKEGAEGAPQEQIVVRFMHRLEALARTRLGRSGYDDEEDVALSAIKSFLIRIPRDEFPYVTNRDSLWGLLAAITLNKVASTRRRSFTKKRDVRREISLYDVAILEPSSELLDTMITEGHRLLESLKDPLCRDVARLRMEGYSNREIAEKIDRSEKTVERKLQRVRKIFRAELLPDV